MVEELKPVLAGYPFVFLGMSTRYLHCSFALHCIGKVGKTCLKDPGTGESRPRRSRCSYDAIACGKYGLRLKPFLRSLKTVMAELCLGSKATSPTRSLLSECSVYQANCDGEERTFQY